MTVPSIERPRPTTPIAAALRRLRQLEPNPVLVKELRSRFRGGRAFWTVSGFVLALTVVVWWIYRVSNVSRFDPPHDFDAAYFGRQLFQSLSWLELIGILIIAPALTFSAICGERERETLDLLLATPLSTWAILRGKLGAAMAYVLLLVFSALPVLSLVFYFGGISWEDVILSQLTIVVAGLQLAALGLLVSVVSRQTGRAAVLAYAGAGMLVLGLWPLIYLASLNWSGAEILIAVSPIRSMMLVFEGASGRDLHWLASILTQVWLAGSFLTVAGWRLTGTLRGRRWTLFLILLLALFLLLVGILMFWGAITSPHNMLP